MRHDSGNRLQFAPSVGHASGGYGFSRVITLLTGVSLRYYRTGPSVPLHAPWPGVQALHSAGCTAFEERYFIFHILSPNNNAPHGACGV